MIHAKLNSVKDINNGNKYHIISIFGPSYITIDKSLYSEVRSQVNIQQATKSNPNICANMLETNK